MPSKPPKPFDIDKLRRDAVEDRYQFVCEPHTFVERYGCLDKSTPREIVAEAEKLVVLCRDGMIRPR